LDLHYKIRPDSDHVAKFQGDRSRELRERVAKKKEINKERKHHEHFISPPVTTVNGRPKKDTSRVKHKPVRNGCSGRPNHELFNQFIDVMK